MKRFYSFLVLPMIFCHILAFSPSSAAFGEVGMPYFDYVRVYKTASPGGHNDIAIDSGGNIFITDGHKHRLLRLEPMSKRLETVNIKLEYRDKPFTPYGIDIDSLDNIYIANPDLHNVTIIDSKGKITKRIGGYESRLQRPVDVALDNGGNLYVLDMIGPDIHIFSPDGNTLNTIQIDEIVPDTSMIDLIVDSMRNIFLTDKELGKVFKISRTGEILEFETVVNKEGLSISPTGIAIGDNGSLFITDSSNGSIFQFSLSGEFIKEHLLIKEYLKEPTSIAFYNNNAYVINEGSGELLQFELNHAVTAIEHELLGERYFEKDLYHEAINELNTAIKLGNDSSSIHYFLGVSYYMIEDFHRSIKHFELTVKTNPGDIEALFQLGNAYNRVNNLNKAIEIYQAAISARPDHLLAQYNLGEIFLKIKELNKAGTHIREALRIAPDYVAAGISLGRLYLEKEEYYMAEKIFLNILEKNHLIREARYFLGLSLFRQQKYKEAISAFTRVSREGPYYVDSLYYLGLSYKALDKNEDARKCFEAVLELRAGHHSAREQLAQISLR